MAYWRSRVVGPKWPDSLLSSAYTPLITRENGSMPSWCSVTAELNRVSNRTIAVIGIDDAGLISSWNAAAEDAVRVEQ